MKSSSIVLATDLSDAAKGAAVWARDMGTRTGLPVIVLHVVAKEWPVRNTMPKLAEPLARSR